ncbi:molybdopterin oxidoreductase family protein [Alkalihalobacillus sp. LMS39]|uniref:molybdopterin oxidoreductase family protein n=1 Tax=Alkalihalobacillus sp. LMS39 TaxID=2924032 RepID=UPI001FB510A7|nr:molybdopterin oxidoreductase family protein [Alkalihalobacillus sp. LMS39]UOE92056.1 molybdopterin oxidoreductase family protein [Alkalihalobacillus sp. LMS39]
MVDVIKEKEGIFKSVCSLDCPDQCGLLVHKKDGKIIKVEGDPEHPVTQGNICNKVRHMTERLYDKNRLQYPMKRTGKKGSGEFTKITWDEAIEIIHEKWSKLMDEDGPESILPYSFYGNMGNLTAEGMDRRFFHRLGASQLERTICQSAGTVGYGYTMGGSLGTDPEETVHSKLIILWGINAVSTNMHQITLAQKARKNGAKIVVIDVHKNQTGRLADWFIPIRPGTDGALALALMHLLFNKNYVDKAFLNDYTVGHEELRQHVQQYTPEWAAKVTGIPVEDILELAKLYGETTPSCIRIGNGLQHHDNGGMSIRTIACLPALTGQWQYQGGGAIKGNSHFLRFNAKALQRPDLLENKQTRTINMNQLGSALLQQEKPVRSLFVYSSNPAIVAPEGNKVRTGLEREDLFTVVHDLFLTETAKYADIVLPATSAFENLDFYTSYWHHYIQLQQPVIEPFGESKSNTDVFRLLAKAFQFEEPCFQDSDKDMIEQAIENVDNPSMEEISFDQLEKQHFMKAKRKIVTNEILPTPSGKIELFSRKMEEDGFEPLPSFTPIYEEHHFPYLFVPAPNHNFLNSTFSNNEKHVSLEKTPKVIIHRDDALKHEIADGDFVRIWNNRGEVVLQAVVGENVLPGVVVTQGLWADKEGENRFVNALTPDRLSDMGKGATFFSGRVLIEKK